jgi:hypothetical protein
LDLNPDDRFIPNNGTCSMLSFSDQLNANHNSGLKNNTKLHTHYTVNTLTKKIINWIGKLPKKDTFHYKSCLFFLAALINRTSMQYWKKEKG